MVVVVEYIVVIYGDDQFSIPAERPAERTLIERSVERASLHLVF